MPGLFKTLEMKNYIEKSTGKQIKLSNNSETERAVKLGIYILAEPETKELKNIKTKELKNLKTK